MKKSTCDIIKTAFFCLCILLLIGGTVYMNDALPDEIKESPIPGMYLYEGDLLLSIPSGNMFCVSKKEKSVLCHFSMNLEELKIYTVEDFLQKYLAEPTDKPIEGRTL